MTDTIVVQKDLQCPSCGGQCVFDPQQGALRCQSCATAHPIHVDPDADPAAELHYHPDLPHTEQTEHTGDTAYSCATCGGQVVFTGPSISEKCAYCDGAIVKAAEQAAYETLGLIPFKIAKEEAHRRANAWVASRRAAPNDLADQMAKGRIAPIYVPFWTFDSREAIEYMVRYRVKRGKRTYTLTKLGTMNTQFDDLLVPASPHVTPLIRDGILHDFDPDDLRPYMPQFLAGFPAERHHQSVTEGLRSNAADKDLLIRNRIKRHSGKSRITHVSYKTHTTGIKYRRILLPVWILHYRYDDKPMKVVTCGLHGRTFGERPFSTAKLFRYSAALATLAVVVGWIWGAVGFL